MMLEDERTGKELKLDDGEADSNSSCEVNNFFDINDDLLYAEIPKDVKCLKTCKKKLNEIKNDMNGKFANIKKVLEEQPDFVGNTKLYSSVKTYVGKKNFSQIEKPFKNVNDEETASISNENLLEKEKKLDTKMPSVIDYEELNFSSNNEQDVASPSQILVDEYQLKKPTLSGTSRVKEIELPTPKKNVCAEDKKPKILFRKKKSLKPISSVDSCTKLNVGVETKKLVLKQLHVSLTRMDDLKYSDVFVKELIKKDVSFIKNKSPVSSNDHNDSRSIVSPKKQMKKKRIANKSAESEDELLTPSQNDLSQLSRDDSFSEEAFFSELKKSKRIVTNKILSGQNRSAKRNLSKKAKTQSNDVNKKDKDFCSIKKLLNLSSASNNTDIDNQFKLGSVENDPPKESISIKKSCRDKATSEPVILHLLPQGNVSTPVFKKSELNNSDAGKNSSALSTPKKESDFMKLFDQVCSEKKSKQTVTKKIPMEWNIVQNWYSRPDDTNFECEPSSTKKCSEGWNLVQNWLSESDVPNFQSCKKLNGRLLSPNKVKFIEKSNITELLKLNSTGMWDSILASTDTLSADEKKKSLDEEAVSNRSDSKKNTRKNVEAIFHDMPMPGHSYDSGHHISESLTEQKGISFPNKINLEKHHETELLQTEISAAPDLIQSSPEIKSIKAETKQLGKFKSARKQKDKSIPLSEIELDVRNNEKSLQSCEDPELPGILFNKSPARKSSGKFENDMNGKFTTIKELEEQPDFVKSHKLFSSVKKHVRKHNFSQIEKLYKNGSVDKTESICNGNKLVKEIKLDTKMPGVIDYEESYFSSKNEQDPASPLRMFVDEYQLEKPILSSEKSSPLSQNLVESGEFALKSCRRKKGKPQKLSLSRIPVQFEEHALECFRKHKKKFQPDLSLTLDPIQSEEHILQCSKKQKGKSPLNSSLSADLTLKCTNEQKINPHLINKLESTDTKQCSNQVFKSSEKTKNQSPNQNSYQVGDFQGTVKSNSQTVFKEHLLPLNSTSSMNDTEISVQPAFTRKLRSSYLVQTSQIDLKPAKRRQSNSGLPTDYELKSENDLSFKASRRKRSLSLDPFFENGSESPKITFRKDRSPKSKRKKTASVEPCLQNIPASKKRASKKRSTESDKKSSLKFKLRNKKSPENDSKHIFSNECSVHNENVDQVSVTNQLVDSDSVDLNNPDNQTVLSSSNENTIKNPSYNLQYLSPQCRVFYNPVKNCLMLSTPTSFELKNVEVEEKELNDMPLIPLTVQNLQNTFQTSLPVSGAISQNFSPIVPTLTLPAAQNLASVINPNNFSVVPQNLLSFNNCQLLSSSSNLTVASQNSASFTNCPMPSPSPSNFSVVSQNSPSLNNSFAPSPSPSNFSVCQNSPSLNNSSVPGPPFSNFSVGPQSLPSLNKCHLLSSSNNLNVVPQNLASLNNPRGMDSPRLINISNNPVAMSLNLTSGGTSSIVNYAVLPSTPVSSSHLPVNRNAIRTPEVQGSNNNICVTLNSPQFCSSNYLPGTGFPSSVTSSTRIIQVRSTQQSISGPNVYDIMTKHPLDIYPRAPLVKRNFDWQCMSYRVFQIDTFSVFDCCQEIFAGKYFLDCTVKQLFSDSYIFHGINEIFIGQSSNLELPFGVEYEYPCTFMDEPVIQLLKDFVHFHVKKIVPKLLIARRGGKDFRRKFFANLLKTFSLSLSAHFNLVIPFEKETFTLEDLICCATFSAIISIFSEYKRRLQSS